MLCCPASAGLYSAGAFNPEAEYLKNAGNFAQGKFGLQTQNHGNIMNMHSRARTSPKMPNPIAAARASAAAIRAEPEVVLRQALKRILSDQKQLDRRRILAGVEAYHRDAMARIPDYRTYPEAKPWVDYVLAYQKELQKITGFNNQQLACFTSLHNYMTFRGYIEAGAILNKPRNIERCRAAFLPQTDQGPIHIKNVDDPILWWKPRPRLKPRASGWKQPPVAYDGVGSGLHIDDEPAEIFPLPVLMMAPHYTDDTPGVLDFLKRYSQFWSGGNLLIFDRKFRSSAVEKCSRNFFESFAPNRHGHSHISGMVCRDPNSPQGRYQSAQRNRYLRIFKLPENNPDVCFWKKCCDMEKMLSDALERFGPKPKADDVMRLFITPYPVGLNKNGLKSHPRQSMKDYTLITHAALLKKRRKYQWQRSQDGNSWPSKPECCRFTS